MRPAHHGLPRWRRWLSNLAVLGVAAVLLFPPARLDCDAPRAVEQAPDGDGALVACPRPPRFGVVPEGSALPGWLSLRDGHGLVAGVVELQRVEALDGTPRWSADRVVWPGFAEFARPEERSWPRAWLRAWLWKWRAILGFVAPDAAFR